MPARPIAANRPAQHPFIPLASFRYNQLHVAPAPDRGKSQLARRIYELKRARRQVAGELVEVNCATLRGDAAMSTLFGHVRGAYTGAVEARAGMLRKADKGLLFLDEIGELGLDEQAMLLRSKTRPSTRWARTGRSAASSS